MIQSVLLMIIVLLIIRGIADYGSHLLTRKAGNHLGKQFYNTLFNKLLNMPVPHYRIIDKYLVTDVSLSYIEKISRSAIQISVAFTRDTLIIIGLLLGLAWLDSDWALMILLLAPFVFIMMQVIQDQHNDPLRSDTHALNILTHQLQRAFDNFKQIRLYGGQQQEYERLSKTVQTIQDNALHQANYRVFITLLCQQVIFFIAIAITYLISQQVLKNTFSLDEIGALIVAVLLMFFPVRRLASLPQAAHDMRKPLEQLFCLLDELILSDQEGGSLGETRGELVFKQISFFSQAQQRNILQSVDLLIKPGESVALVCENKQTSAQLVDLMLGFCPPTAGQLLIDGHPFAEIKQADLLAQFAVISKEPIILSDEVAGNIAYGFTQCANEASITAAAQAALASTFIREMPDGFQTRVEDKGASLTREQWQQIAIARALLKNPPVLIIDDLWPGPDQKRLHAALSHLVQKRTTIILLHTLPVTRENIDRVLLLKEGILIEK